MKKMIDICFIDDTDNTFILNLKFPKNITVNEMEKSFYLKFGYNQKNMILYDYSYHLLKNYKDKKVYELYRFVVLFKIAGEGLIGGYIQCFGKRILVDIYDKNKKTIILKAYPGLLNSNKNLINYIEANLSIKLKKMSLNNKEVNLNEIRSLSSLDITDDCYCVIDY